MNLREATIWPTQVADAIPAFVLVVHYILITPWSRPSVLYVVPAIVETNIMLKLFSSPPHWQTYLCTVTHIHSDHFGSIRPGMCSHLWFPILRQWLILLILRQCLVFCHWSWSMISSKTAENKSWLNRPIAIVESCTNATRSYISRKVHTLLGRSLWHRVSEGFVVTVFLQRRFNTEA